MVDVCGIACEIVLRWMLLIICKKNNNNKNRMQPVELFYVPWSRTALRPRQNGRHFAKDSFKCIFMNENVSISIKISLKFDPKDRNNNNPALIQIMALRRPGDKPLSEPMVGSLLTHMCVTRPQWVNFYCVLLLRYMILFHDNYR